MDTGERQARLIEPFPDSDDDDDDENALMAVPKEAAHHDRTLELVGSIVGVGSSGPVDLGANGSLVQALDELKELSYDPRQAERVMREPGMIAVLLRLSDPTHVPFGWPEGTRRLASMVLGTMVQNNPELQGMAQRAGAVSSLLSALREERDAKTAGKHVFALSALTRGHASSLDQFTELGGLQVLRELNPLASSVYKAGEESLKLDQRITRFVEDLLNPDFNPDVPPHVASLVAKFAATWCQTLGLRLVDSLEDIVDDDGGGGVVPVYENRLAYLRSLQLLRVAHPDTCQLPPEFRYWVREELAYIEKTKNDQIADYREALTDLDE
ncbi:nucleotide exchange factor sil1 [Coemansia sp. RSA 552]|nr:nucleotide exchange factor sil1 [Coemansia sp. RSA 552]